MRYCIPQNLYQSEMLLLASCWEPVANAKGSKWNSSWHRSCVLSRAKLGQLEKLNICCHKKMWKTWKRSSRKGSVNISDGGNLTRHAMFLVDNGFPAALCPKGAKEIVKLRRREVLNDTKAQFGELGYLDIYLVQVAWKMSSTMEI